MTTTEAPRLTENARTYRGALYRYDVHTLAELANELILISYVTR